MVATDSYGEGWKMKMRYNLLLRKGQCLSILHYPKNLLILLEDEAATGDAGGNPPRIFPAAAENLPWTAGLLLWVQKLGLSPTSPSLPWSKWWWHSPPSPPRSGRVAVDPIDLLWPVVTSPSSLSTPAAMGYSEIQLEIPMEVIFRLNAAQ